MQLLKSTCVDMCQGFFQFLNGELRPANRQHSRRFVSSLHDIVCVGVKPFVASSLLQTAFFQHAPDVSGRITRIGELEVYALPETVSGLAQRVAL